MTIKPDHLDETAVGIAPADPTEVYDYPPSAPTPIAYGDETVESRDSIPTRRIRWSIPTAVMLSALALVILSLTLWVQETDGASPTVIWQPAPVVTQTMATKTATITVPDRDSAFLMELEDLNPRHIFPAGVELHNAHYVCDALTGGRTIDWVAQQLSSYPLGDQKVTPIGIMDDPGEAQGFIRVVIQYYCPKVSVR